MVSAVVECGAGGPVAVPTLLPIVVVCALVAGIGGASAACAVLTMVLNAMAPASASIGDTLLRSFFVLSSALAGYLLAVMLRERERTATELEYRGAPTMP